MQTQQKKFRIIVIYPGKRISRIYVKEDSTPIVINNYFKDFDVNLLFNGAPLDGKLSFKFYGIKNDDIIVVIPKNANKKMLSGYWMSLSHDDASFREDVSNLINPKISQEAGKINELRLLKLESKPKAYRKFLREIHDDTLMPLHPMKTVVPDKSSTPSIEPLPCFWNTSSANAKRAKIPVVPIVKIKNKEIEIQNNDNDNEKKILQDE